jgi:hypothetical protein
MCGSEAGVLVRAADGAKIAQQFTAGETDKSRDQPAERATGSERGAIASEWKIQLEDFEGDHLKLKASIRSPCSRFCNGSAVRFTYYIWSVATIPAINRRANFIRPLLLTEARPLKTQSLAAP